MNRSRISNVIAFLALFACMAGTATAAKLITGKNIKNASVTGKDIKNGSLGAGDLSAKAKSALAGAPGAVGPAGPAGAQGPAGPAGAAGAAGPAVAPKAFAAALQSKILPPDSETVVLEKAVPDGTYAITAKVVLFQAAADNGGCSLLAGSKVVDDVAVIPSAANTRTPIALTAVAPAGASGAIKVSCQVDDQQGTAQTTRIVAVAVGEVG